MHNQNSCDTAEQYPLMQASSNGSLLRPIAPELKFGPPWYTLAAKYRPTTIKIKVHLVVAYDTVNKYSMTQASSNSSSPNYCSWINAGIAYPSASLA